MRHSWRPSLVTYLEYCGSLRVTPLSVSGAVARFGISSVSPDIRGKLSAMLLNDPFGPKTM